MNIVLMIITLACMVTFALWLFSTTDVGVAHEPGFFEQFLIDSERISKQHEEDKEYDRKRLEITFNHE